MADFRVEGSRSTGLPIYIFVMYDKYFIQSKLVFNANKTIGSFYNTFDRYILFFKTPSPGKMFKIRHWTHLLISYFTFYNMSILSSQVEGHLYNTNSRIFRSKLVIFNKFIIYFINVFRIHNTCMFCHLSFVFGYKYY